MESKVVEVLKKDINSYEELKKNGKKCLTTNNEECCFVHYPEIKKALLVLEFNDCVAFGYWLVNAPNKELYSKKWIEQKYQQYLREKESDLK